MEISIIIVNYKSDEPLVRCLKSIKEFPPKVSYEVIVVDNNKVNVGFARGVNKGIKKSKGKYILLLNPDTEVKEGSIGKLYEFAKTHPDAGVVGPKLLNKDGTVQASVFHSPLIARAIREYWLGEKGTYGQYVPRADDAIEVDALVAAAFLIAPQAIQKVGLLDERYFMYFEDLDYCRRVRKAGLSVYYFPDAEIVHYHGMSGKNLVPSEVQWRRLIPSSKIYHGTFRHYLLNFVIWSGQKCQKLLNRG